MGNLNNTKEWDSFLSKFERIRWILKHNLCAFYSTTQLQGNVYTRVTHEQLACISCVLVRVLAMERPRVLNYNNSHCSLINKHYVFKFLVLLLGSDTMDFVQESFGILA